eukprot:1827592-Alexandrium_andersonii.AAC.1
MGRAPHCVMGRALSGQNTHSQHAASSIRKALADLDTQAFALSIPSIRSSTRRLDPQLAAN